MFLFSTSMSDHGLLCAAGWWESKAKHWSVCVAFWYTSVLTVPSSSLVRSTSRKGSCTLDSLSTVNRMFESMLLRCSWKWSTMSQVSMVYVSSMYLLQIGEGCGRWLDPCVQCPQLPGLPPPTTQETPLLCHGPAGRLSLQTQLSGFQAQAEEGENVVYTDWGWSSFTPHFVSHIICLHLYLYSSALSITASVFEQPKLESSLPLWNLQKALVYKI